VQTPPRPNLIWESNPEFWINPDPDVGHIAPKMYCIHSVVGTSRFAKYHKNRPMTPRGMLINLVKNPPFHNGERNGKVIQNPYAGPDHDKKLTTSRGSSLAHAHHVWSTSVNTIVSYIAAHRMTDRKT